MSAATVTLPAELEARAGASDKDRPAWLNERAHGVTATEVRDLYLKRRGYPGKTEEQLIAEKLPFLLATSPGEVEAAAAGGFGGNRFTAWGNTREPVIAEQLREQFGMLPESRVFRSASNPRHLASPDGIRVGEDGRLEVSEIKTSGVDIAPETDAYRKKGYDIQQTWVTGVIGAWRSLYAWEQHDGDWQWRGGEFQEPEPLDLFVPTAWVSFDDDLFAELVAIADAFLERLDAALAAARAGDGPVVDEELDTLAVNYLRGLDEEKAGADLKKKSWDSILERVDAGEPVLQETALTRVSFSPAVVEEEPVFGIDEDAARAANPELYRRRDLAQAELDSARDALGVEALAVAAHETAFARQTGTERVVKKKAALRVTAAKDTKKEKAA
ncbi:YqaJ viral recombinase family protein [Curtobacterium sp. Csp1]|uniref:YqaJ viral recombinase family protein n=1 Tax=unclassified Curtobacterium TaxID=257496 RepID=UPI0015976A6E|nr:MULTISPECIES: YqaJ viral recombinase family protein [unclassified Curtobacterium]QKS13919.1 YqaJ viral recombinase family protein [Curtobacterium sp. csp3]QKS20962.1 YqaJ viral recombinase family protein [Curtobacterium sp. Csp1]